MGGNPLRRRLPAPTLPCQPGANSFGQLGLGHQQRLLRFAPITCLIDKDITTLQAGDFNSGAISEEGTVYVWGRCVDAGSA